MIVATGLRKEFGAIAAVDGVSLRIERGETFGLLGPNGAGKTTTIHMMTGVLAPDEGRVELEDGSSPTEPSARRKIGVAPQAVSLYEDLSGRQNLAFFGRLYGLGGGRLKERVAWALGFAGLEDRADDRVGVYSGGMQRRLNLACALVHEPAVVFCDEPTVGVDPQSRNHIFDSIERLRAGGTTIVYTTHYMEEAQRLCDRVAIMDRGKVLALDTVEGLISSHGGLSTVTAELARSAPDGGPETDGDEERTLRIETDKPLEEIAALAGRGVRLQTLRVDRPNLETVFLSLTGRRLRDD